MQTEKVDRTQAILRVVYGVVPIVAGLDKFTNLLTDWKKYLSPVVANMISPSLFMHLVGVVEISAGILVLSKLTRFGAYVVTIWLLAIALNLLTTGHYLDVAVRDIVMAFGSFTLAQLTEARRGVEAPQRVVPTGRTPLAV
jgi:uncharacterized membrane protein YphA (DoxX/SURF4 family)